MATLIKWTRRAIGAVWVICVCVAMAAIALILWIDEQLEREP